MIQACSGDWEGAEVAAADTGGAFGRTLQPCPGAWGSGLWASACGRRASLFLFLEKVLGQSCPDDVSTLLAAKKDRGTPFTVAGRASDGGSPAQGASRQRAEMASRLRSLEGATWGRGPSPPGSPPQDRAQGGWGSSSKPRSGLPGEKSASTASWLLVLCTHFSEDQPSLCTPAHSCPSHTHTLLCTLTHAHTLALSCAHSHAHSHTLTPHHPPHPLSRKDQKLLYRPLVSPRHAKLGSSSQGPPGQEGGRHERTPGGQGCPEDGDPGLLPWLPPPGVSGIPTRTSAEQELWPCSMQPARARWAHLLCWKLPGGPGLAASACWIHFSRGIYVFTSS